jgi:fluoroacetyl-CoA thioesterase
VQSACGASVGSPHRGQKVGTSGVGTARNLTRVPVPVGLVGSITHVVTDGDTALSVGSGDLPVLATPRLLALAEAATLRALAGVIAEGETSVGTRVQLEHVAPTAVGASVEVTATVVHVDGRLVRFDVAAVGASGALLGHGTVTRVVVDRERFLARLTGDDA